jgi:hypothetical protein
MALLSHVGAPLRDFTAWPCLPQRAASRHFGTAYLYIGSSTMISTQRVLQSIKRGALGS